MAVSSCQPTGMLPINMIDQKRASVVFVMCAVQALLIRFIGQTEAKIVLETALICAQEPLRVDDMRRLLADAISADMIRALLEALRMDWSGRGVELVSVATGWRFQSRPAMRAFLDRLNPEKPPKYSRAVLETLAIIAYRQPVTRGDIEEIRGVTVNTQVVKQLEDRGWIEVIGHRGVPGRPALYATTRQFLDDLGMRTLDELPPLSDPTAQGQVDLLAQRAIGWADGAEASSRAVAIEAAIGTTAHEAADTGSVPCAHDAHDRRRRCARVPAGSGVANQATLKGRTSAASREPKSRDAALDVTRTPTPVVLNENHDPDSPESGPARAAAVDDLDAGQRAVQAPSAVEGGDGEGRPRRGLRRGPRSLIARRRAVAKSQSTDAAADGAPAVVAEAPPDGEVVAHVRMPRKDLASKRQGKGAKRDPNVRRDAAAPRREPRPQRSVGQGAASAGGAHKGNGCDDDVFAYVTSPAFDADNNSAGGVRAPMLRRGSKGAAPTGRRTLSADDDAPKLHKVLAEAGMGSRREMEELIIAGRVSVNGEPAHIGQRIMPTDQVRINGKPVKRKLPNKPPRVLIYHKPAGEIVSHADPQGRPSVFDKLPPMKTAKWLAVGRLDFNTEGLLLLTTSGDLANRFMHPRYQVEREYAVRVIGELSEGARQKLLGGIELDDGLANFLRIQDGGGEGTNRWYHVTLAEGRNREVRRMFEAVGLMVSRLIRTRHGSIVLPRGLKRGRWEELEDNPVRA
ncbi:hypothetical protein DFQ30_000903, partial [Apophysomyces sp. BC1015]